MERLVARSVELDSCPRCRGIWFDRGELEQVLDRKLGHPLGRETSSSICPRCKNPLTRFRSKNESAAVCEDGVWMPWTALSRFSGGPAALAAMGLLTGAVLASVGSGAAPKTQPKTQQGESSVTDSVLEVVSEPLGEISDTTIEVVLDAAGSVLELVGELFSGV
ncbi:MAG: zf-TFIIB domain-containing protein [Deltaproteobacteria bacterium]|nr:zf-TFIIB domain-containing protein [Deltaproteobacteria bacterium]